MQCGPKPNRGSVFADFAFRFFCKMQLHVSDRKPTYLQIFFTQRISKMVKRKCSCGAKTPIPKYHCNFTQYCLPTEKQPILESHLICLVLIDCTPRRRDKENHRCAKTASTVCVLMQIQKYLVCDQLKQFAISHFRGAI